MYIRFGFDIEIHVEQPTTILTALDIEPSRRRDIVHASGTRVVPVEAMDSFIDVFGNQRARSHCPAGTVRLSADGVIRDSGRVVPCPADAEVHPVAGLPHETLPFLLGSRYCETDLLAELAWNRFGAIRGGGARVQAVCDYVHARLAFGYAHASATRTAAEAHGERVGVCRDFAHLAIALCRALNIPARYCNGYLGDIGVPPDPAPMDFSAWFEVFLGGRWHTFDARHNRPRPGRIVVARGRDAMDIPMLHTFGPHRLTRFRVVTEETDAPPEGLPGRLGPVALPDLWHRP